MANKKAIVGKPGYSIKRKSNKEALKVLYCNARSIRNKMDELRGVIAMEGLDIIGITESWANSDDVPDFFEIKGFNLFRQDRFDKKGGGVMLYVRSDLNCIELNFKCEPRVLSQYGSN